MKFKKYLALQMCIIALAVTGCGSTYESASYSGGYSNDIELESASYGISNNYAFDAINSTANSDYVLEPEEAIVEEYDKDLEPQEEVAFELTEEKLVYTASVSIETKEYDTSKEYIYDLLNENGGIIQSEQESDNSYRWYYANYEKDEGTMRLDIECRVPSKNYDKFIEGLDNFSEHAKIRNKSASVENITQQYHDNTIKIETLKVQEERLMNMLEKAESIQDMLSIESRLIDVQTELNILTAKRITMDTDVAYSYIHISLEEVLEYSEQVVKSTFFTRMAEAFSDVCDFTGELFEGIIIAIMYLIPLLILIGIPVLLVVKLVIVIVKKYEEKHPRKPEVTIYRKCKTDKQKLEDDMKDLTKEEKED